MSLNRSIGDSAARNVQGTPFLGTVDTTFTVRPVIENSEKNEAPRLYNVPEIGRGDAPPRKKIQKRIQKKADPTPNLFRNVRGRRGALSGIVEMPLDILYESFMHLTSVDILHLSQTCKALRRILMTKSARFIWKQARLNLGDEFPDCPDDLNEAQYAAFVFGTLCDYCNERKKPCYIWTVRRRSCKQCIDEQNDFLSFNSFEKLHMDLRHILPSIYTGVRCEIILKGPFIKSDRQLICKKSAAIICERYNQLAPGDRDSWVEAQYKERERRIEHGLLLQLWFQRQDRNRHAELKNVRQRRYEAISQRLVDLGWEEELKAVSIKNLPSVKQSKELTDRNWEKVKDKILKSLQPARRRLEEEKYLAVQWRRRDLLRRHLRDLEKKHFYRRAFPEKILSELESMDGIPALIKAPTSEQVHFPESLLLERVNEWLKKRHSELRSLINASPTQAQILRPDEIIDPLCLATTFFRRLEEYDLRVYPQALSDIANTEFMMMKFADKAFHIAKAVLEASGLDPATTTRKIVDEDFFLECGECTAYTSGQRHLMAWNTGIRHALEAHATIEHPRVAQAILNESEIEALKKLVAEDLKDPGRVTLEFEDFECARCWQLSKDRFVGTANGLRSHIDQQTDQGLIHNTRDSKSHGIAIEGLSDLAYREDFVIASYSGCRRQPRRVFIL